MSHSNEFSRNAAFVEIRKILLKENDLKEQLKKIKERICEHDGLINQTCLPAGLRRNGKIAGLKKPVAGSWMRGRGLDFEKTKITNTKCCGK